MVEIEEILLKEEIVFCGVDFNVIFMVEGRVGFYFMDDLDGLVYEKVIDEMFGKLGYYKVVYGYFFKKLDYKIMIIFNGFGIKKGDKISNVYLVDEVFIFVYILDL